MTKDLEDLRKAWKAEWPSLDEVTGFPVRKAWRKEKVPETSATELLAARLKARREGFPEPEPAGVTPARWFRPIGTGAVELRVSWAPLEEPRRLWEGRDPSLVPEGPAIEWALSDKLRHVMSCRIAMLAWGPLHGDRVPDIEGFTRDQRNVLVDLLFLLDWWDATGDAQECLAIERTRNATRISPNPIHDPRNDTSRLWRVEEWIHDSARLLRAAIAYRIGAALHVRSSASLKLEKTPIVLTAYHESGCIRVAARTVVRDLNGNLTEQTIPLVDITPNPQVAQRMTSDLHALDSSNPHHEGPRAPVFITTGGLKAPESFTYETIAEHVLLVTGVS